MIRREAAAAVPAFDYDKEGASYASHRNADPRIASAIHEALGGARKVLNVGAGAGSYEPLDRLVVAVEPSEAMRRQRPRHLVPAIDARAERLPFDDGAFDASMAILTVHHWPDRAAGLREMRRVTRGPVVVMTFDADAPTEFWMFDYAPEMAEVERRRYGSLRPIVQALGGVAQVLPVPVAKDCSDRFQAALYARPEEFLDPKVRESQSAWRFLPPGVEERVVRDLAKDIESGEWDRRYGRLRNQPFVRCQLRLVVARAAE